MSFLLTNRKLILFISLVVLITSIRSFLRITALFGDLDSNEILRRFDHFIYFFGFPFFISFSYEIFQSKFSKFIRIFSIYYSLPFIILLFVPNHFYIKLRIFYHIFTLFSSIYLVYISFSYLFIKEKYSKLKFFGFLILFFGLLSDILIVEILKIAPFVLPITMIIFSFYFVVYFNYNLERQKNELLKLKEELINAKEEVEQQYEIAKQNQGMLQRLNLLYESLLELSKKISTTKAFDSILDEIAGHLEMNFGIKYFVIMIVNSEKKRSYFFNSNLDKKLTKEQYESMIKGEGEYYIDLTKVGAHSAVYKHKKPLYLKHFSETSKKSLYEFENQMIDKLNLKSLIIFPLIYNDEVFGLFDITHADEPLRLSNEEYLNLNIFIQYFSMIFKNYLLYQEIEERKNQLEIANKEITEQNNIILKMNQILSEINITFDLTSILEKLINFLKESFLIRYYLFYIYDKSKNALIYHTSNLKEIFSEEVLDQLKQNHIFLKEPYGIHASCCFKRKYIYLPKMKNSKDPIENRNLELLKMKSVLIFPLYVGNELLGTLDFSHIEEELSLTKVQLSLINIFVEQFAAILKNKLLIQDLEENQLKLEKSLYELEAAKRDLEKLNEFAKKINSQSDFSEIIDDIFEYFSEKYDLKFGWLILVDEIKKVFRGSAFSKTFYNYDSYINDFLTNFEIPLEENSGTLFRTYQRKKVFYIPKIKDDFIGKEIDRTIIKILKLKWLIQIPLIVKDKVIGVLAFTNYEKVVHLNQNQLQSILYFCEQIAGALYNTFLLNQIQKEKQNVELAQQELKQLNEFTKLVIEEDDFEKLIQKIFLYLRNRFKLQFGWLLLIDKEKNRIRTSSFTKDVEDHPKELNEFLSNFDEPITPELGTIYRTIIKKKHLYIKRINPNFMGSKLDKEIVQISKIRWVLYIPLMIKDEVIGILAFTNYKEQVVLTINDIQSISIFCNQISGAIYNSYLKESIAKEKEKSEKLLLNILPKKVADELKNKGYVQPKLFQSATVLFTDFVGFTRYASQLSPENLIKELDLYFTQFDEIIVRNNLTKLKTIGDAYMCVGGIPEENKTHAVDACLAALEIQNIIIQANDIRKLLNTFYLEVRIGINTGPIIAGIIGKERFAYDVWGDTVNIAQRLESSSLPYQINISLQTYQIVKYFFVCEYRGKHAIKNRGRIDMYFLKRIHPKLSADQEGRIPNERFKELYEKLKKGAKFAFKHELKQIQ